MKNTLFTVRVQGTKASVDTLDVALPGVNATVLITPFVMALAFAAVVA